VRSGGYDRCLRPLATLSLIGVAALGLSACGGSSNGTGDSASPRPPGPTVTLDAPGHHPTANAPWPIRIEVRAPNGRPLRAEVRYQFLFGGSVVARRSHFHFKGTLHDIVRWPQRSVGIPLTFRAVVRTPLGTRNLDYAVTVRR
jgi:hypothetical protein